MNYRRNTCFRKSHVHDDLAGRALSVHHVSVHRTWSVRCLQNKFCGHLAGISLKGQIYLTGRWRFYETRGMGDSLKMKICCLFRGTQFTVGYLRERGRVERGSVSSKQIAVEETMLHSCVFMEYLTIFNNISQHCHQRNMLHMASGQDMHCFINISIVFYNTVTKASCSTWQVGKKVIGKNVMLTWQVGKKVIGKNVSQYYHQSNMLHIASGRESHWFIDTPVMFRLCVTRPCLDMWQVYF